MSTERVAAWVGESAEILLGHFDTAGAAALAAQDAGYGAVRVAYSNGHEAVIRIARTS